MSGSAPHCNQPCGHWLLVWCDCCRKTRTPRVAGTRRDTAARGLAHDVAAVKRAPRAALHMTAPTCLQRTPTSVLWRQAICLTCCLSLVRKGSTDGPSPVRCRYQLSIAQVLGWAKLSGRCSFVALKGPLLFAPLQFVVIYGVVIFDRSAGLDIVCSSLPV
jgi:hypothetical protein